MERRTSTETTSVESASRRNFRPHLGKFARWLKPAGPVALGAILSLITSFVVLELQARSAAELQNQAIEQTRELAVREQRRPVYLEYLNRANDWVQGQIARSEQCVPGTDESLPGNVCTVGYLSELQSLRYDLRGAQNELSIVESQDMLRMRQVFEMTFPSPESRAQGPIEGPVDPIFGDLYVLMLDLTTCDANPAPDVTHCENLRESVDQIADVAGIPD